MEFQIGDRVQAVRNVDIIINEGDIGTVVNMNWGHVGVRWDIPSPYMHDAGGDCEDGHGWYVPREFIEHYISEEDDTELNLDTADILALYGTR